MPKDLRAKSDDELIAIATDPTTLDSVRADAIHELTVERCTGVMFPPTPGVR
jgi:hypothetical protein